jgi:hypothetical protein
MRSDFRVLHFLSLMQFPAVPGLECRWQPCIKYPQNVIIEQLSKVINISINKTPGVIIINSLTPSEVKTTLIGPHIK